MVSPNFRIKNTFVSMVAQRGKNPPAMQETWVRSLGWEDPLEKRMASISVFLPGESRGRGAWWAAAHGVAESDTAEQLTLVSIGIQGLSTV